MSANLTANAAFTLELAHLNNGAGRHLWIDVSIKTEGANKSQS